DPRPADLGRFAELRRRRGEVPRARAILAGLADRGHEALALLPLRDLVLELGDRGPEGEKVLRGSLQFEPDHERTLRALYRILEERCDTQEGSLPLYEKILSLDPALPWAHQAVAEILKARGHDGEAARHYLEAKRPSEAEELLRRGAEARPRDEAALGALKDFYLGQRRVDADARAVYERWRSLRPDDETLPSLMAALYEDRGYHGPDAVEFYERAVMADPGRDRAKVLLAESYRDAGRLRDAVWLLEEARDDFPAKTEVHRALVRMYVACGMKTERALRECLDYVGREYDETVAAFLRDHFLANGEPEGLPEAALEVWRARHPDDAEALERLARLHAAAGNAAKGIPLLRALAAGAAPPAWAVRALANLHAASGDRSPEAEQAFARAIAAGGAGDPVLLALATIYAGQRRRDPLAGEVYHRAAAIAGCPPEAKTGLAEIYFAQGAWEDAAGLCEEVLRERPGHEEASRLKARALLKGGQYEGALEGLWKTFREAPGDLRACEDLAQALAARGTLTPQAVAVYERYVRVARKGKGPVDFEAGTAVLRTLALAWFRSGQAEKAVGILKALYGRESSRAAGERLAGEAGAGAAPATALALGIALLELGDFSRAQACLLPGVRGDRAALARAAAALREARVRHPKGVAQVIQIAEALQKAEGDDPRLEWEIVEAALAEGDAEGAAARSRKILGPGAGPDPALPGELPKAMEARWTEAGAGKDRELPAALYLLGRLRLMRGAPEEALPALERARSLDARDRQVLDALRRTLEALLAREERDDLKESLADVRIETGDLDGAIPVLQKVSDACPRKREVTAKLARCFLEKGHPLVASRSLERALGDEEISAENVEVFYTLARAYEAAADLRKAKLAFERIGFFRYDYKDVRERLASLTAKVASTPSTPVTPSPLAPVPERSTLGGLETAELPSGRLLVALKVLPEEFAHREKAVRLLKREASAAVQLSHPGIVRIFSTGEEQGKRYISMEYIEGPDLATVLDRKGKIPADAAEGILRQALDALGYAHRAGVIHKDIKPSNIMLTEDTPAGRVKITDFGIARVVTDQIGFSRTLSVRGTLPYMSPQQIAGEPADAQSDLYSLGITFYEMLAGEPPFSRGDVAYQHTYKEPAPPSALAEGIPPRLEAVVMKCLQKKLVNRYKSAEEILGDLDRKA
ncbi:MAG: protein kinase, partial [Planctomycetes bacterium]|nr:protein kinase [Planctomycetota bacterium]